MRRHELSNEQWEKIKDLLPPERKPQGRRQAKNNRIMMNGIIYWFNTGVAWRDLPERFESWQSVYDRFRNWTNAGIWEKVFNELIKNNIVDYENLMIDSTIIKVHQYANDAQKGIRSKRTFKRRISK